MIMRLTKIIFQLLKAAVKIGTIVHIFKCTIIFQSIAVAKLVKFKIILKFRLRKIS